MMGEALMSPTSTPNKITFPTTASLAFLVSSSGSTLGGAGPPSLIILSDWTELALKVKLIN